MIKKILYTSFLLTCSILLSLFGGISNAFALGNDIWPKLTNTGLVQNDISFSTSSSPYYDNFLLARDFANSCSKDNFIIYPDNWMFSAYSWTSKGSNQVNVVCYNDSDVLTPMGFTINKRNDNYNILILTLFDQTTAILNTLPRMTYYDNGLSVSQNFNTESWDTGFVGKYQTYGYNTSTDNINYTFNIYSNKNIIFKGINNYWSSSFAGSEYYPYKTFVNNGVMYNTNDIVFSSVVETPPDPYLNFISTHIDSNHTLLTGSGTNSHHEILIPFGISEGLGVKLYSYDRSNNEIISEINILDKPVIQKGEQYFYSIKSLVDVNYDNIGFYLTTVNGTGFDIYSSSAFTKNNFLDSYSTISRSVDKWIFKPLNTSCLYFTEYIPADIVESSDMLIEIINSTTAKVEHSIPITEKFLNFYVVSYDVCDEFVVHTPSYVFGSYVPINTVPTYIIYTNQPNNYNSFDPAKYGGLTDYINRFSSPDGTGGGFSSGTGLFGGGGGGGGRFTDDNDFTYFTKQMTLLSSSYSRMFSIVPIQFLYFSIIIFLIAALRFLRGFF